MPKTTQKAPKGATSAAASMDAEINDTRFSNFATDPRFRLPSKKHTRTKIDKRFSRMLKDEDFSNTAKVDRYGRKLSSAGKKKALERLYVPDEEEQGDEEEEVDVEVEDDDIIQKELDKASRAYDPARGGGFSSSSEDEDDEDEESGGVEIEEAVFPDMQAEQAAVEMGEISSRIAVVNLDWDNIRSVDLMAVFSSFLPVGGRIHKISIYPSEFGKERMDREELEGPPKEIFTKKQEDQEIQEEESDDSEDEEDEDEEVEEKIKKDLQKADDGQEFDGAALRHYQLERLRYYYAVLICSDNDTAQKIYESTDGREYLSSANFFDLRFIPDGVEFDDKPRDECDSVPAGYRPTEFTTDALQHSKVKLTWDMDPEEVQRKDAINRAFSGSRAELGQNDLQAYLGSDSEDDEDEQPAEVVEDGQERKSSKRELERRKLRAALGLSDEPTSKKKEAGPVGDMEITFTAGLTSNGKEGVFENSPIIEETTAEKYIRKERERKARKKEKAIARREGRDPNAAASGATDRTAAKDVETKDLGFDDPFFATDGAVKETASKSLRKEERRKKREAKEVEAAAKALERAELELLIQDNTTEAAERLDHFDINEIARAEKRAKKGKKAKGKEQSSKRGGLQESFEMDVADERFAGRLFGNHEFAIDPSNPKFKGTGGMKKLLEEGRKQRDIVGDVENTKDHAKKRKVDGGKGDLTSLVESVKKKARK